jgi:hypothetical protein
MLLQNYSLDMGYVYNFTKYSYFQSLVIQTIPNQEPLIVLQTFLPTINALVIQSNIESLCALQKGLTARRVEIELQNNTKYTFDIPFNSSDTTRWGNLLNDLENLGIKNWNISGEKVRSSLVNRLLNKVP